MLLSHFTHDLIEAGLDEAGRGCLAGPVVAAAVILPRGFGHDQLNDSKKLTHKQREQLRPIIEKEAIAYAVAVVDNTQIDEINILNASFLAMHHALDQLACDPQLLLIDGNRFKKYKTLRHECIIQGDGKYLSIAAASILAKTYRDELMVKLAQQHPDYFWQENKGYPTPAHRQAIRAQGITPYHRKSFRLLEEQLELEFTGLD